MSTENAALFVGKISLAPSNSSTTCLGRWQSNQLRVRMLQGCAGASPWFLKTMMYLKRRPASGQEWSRKAHARLHALQRHGGQGFQCDWAFQSPPHAPRCVHLSNMPSAWRPSRLQLPSAGNLFDITRTFQPSLLRAPSLLGRKAEFGGVLLSLPD